jgi:hypothetical protein
MKRVKVYLHPQQIEALRVLAKRRGTSMAELVRQAMDCLLAEEDSLVVIRPYALCAGEFTVPDELDTPLPEDVVAAFEGQMMVHLLRR